jgi:hypothetical protein
MNSIISDTDLPRFIKPRQVQAMLGGINRGTLRELIDEGVIPPPVEFNSRLRLFEYAPLIEAVRRRARKVAA